MTSHRKDIILITSTDKTNKAFGTGFVFWKEDRDSYVLTCAHVIEEVGKDTICIGTTEQVEVVACGTRDYADLAILKVANLSEPALNLCNLYEQENISFCISGFYQEGPKNPIIGKDVEGTTESQITFSKDKLDGWSLNIKENNHLQKGYSGSPVVDKETGKVFAVATHEKDSGNKGYAISVRHLLKIWNDAKVPDELRKILGKNVSKGNTKRKRGEPCELLIKLSKERDNFYTVEAWLTYPSQEQDKPEFEPIYVQDKSIDLGGESGTTQLITELQHALDEVDDTLHQKVRLEFIVPMDLYLHPFEQWIDESGDPIGAFFPIAIRSQERLHLRELTRHWKSIQPDLEKLLSNKVFWLDKPQAKLLHLKLKDHFCFALQFDLCNVEQEFLRSMLKYGIPVALWSRCCQDFSSMQQQVSALLNDKSLADLPVVLKEFRATQWAEDKYDYHLTLFWDDKDRILPSLSPNQLQSPSL